MKRQDDGFTFVQVLLIAGIIAILATICFPFVKAPLDKNGCFHNLTQLGLASKAYLSDYGSFSPYSTQTVRDNHGNIIIVGHPDKWRSSLISYCSKDKSVFFNPADKHKERKGFLAKGDDQQDNREMSTSFQNQTNWALLKPFVHEGLLYINPVKVAEDDYYLADWFVETQQGPDPGSQSAHGTFRHFLLYSGEVTYEPIND